ncbi:hypothetical protein BGW36DRAFT_376875 [Talaromyces proteolyticus]|uniref:Mitochondrial distribution and morphology protein 12 n=1 Tax=Talaromyces proteolyticus TaxID=1131652 RepID=A0AAD4Q1M2_9EURO|nr:uncharacterized protein BGW36DRAFT_376875 [Talaromyces proteolyticus]KAH8698864.1 hypothetical protein BGW36DRAFT_376875 [Talaromyces proteolyticus]
MSIDLDWEAATSGPDGEELAERIRSFIHDKFQQVPLPRFIRSVQVHSFEFGKIPPELEIKDLCDPFPDFYEEDDDSADGYSGYSVSEPSNPSNEPTTDQRTTSRASTDMYDDYSNNNGLFADSRMRPPTLDFRHQPSLRSPIGLGDHLNSQFRSGSPSILPGGTSNLGYHLMLGSLSGSQTPLAAVASGSTFSSGWPDVVHETRGIGGSSMANAGGSVRRGSEIEVDNGSPSRPSTANTNPTLLSQGRSAAGSSSNNTSNDPTVIYNDHTSSVAHTHIQDDASSIIADRHETPRHLRERRPEDFQVICRVKYAGDVKLSLTAEILLDYPMPSFVGLPLKLNIAGVTFDGVAVVAYIRKRAHLCFLSPEDADAFCGEEDQTGRPNATASDDAENQIPARRRFGSLLQQIHVESEIGRNESGKQVLKNVGKVERFVLDQVRRIFEDEFVFPSFWTFLL